METEDWPVLPSPALGPDCIEVFWLPLLFHVGSARINLTLLQLCLTWRLALWDQRLVPTGRRTEECLPWRPLGASPVSVHFFPSLSSECCGDGRDPPSCAAGCLGLPQDILIPAHPPTPTVLTASMERSRDHVRPPPPPFFLTARTERSRGHVLPSIAQGSRASP